jgi:carboxyl-terminal processing protease
LRSQKILRSTIRKEEIVSIITDEIIKRYFYQEGLYEYYLQNDPEILQAREILSNPRRYADILK